MRGFKNLNRILLQADDMDIDDGMNAYSRYHKIMAELSSHYKIPLHSVVGAFVALSPNSDYLGNLRSLVTLLEAKKKGVPYEHATVSTYNACRARAILYLKGTEFLDHAKGLKTRAFYHNILYPDQEGPVTIDGHMYWAWEGGNGGMRDAKVTTSVYRQISFDICQLANAFGILPHHTQAIIWFTRKRLQGVVYTPQLDLFHELVGYQKTSYSVHEIKPYNIKD